MIIFYNKASGMCIRGIDRDNISNTCINDYTIILGIFTIDNTIVWSGDRIIDNADTVSYISAPLQSIIARETENGFENKHVSDLRTYTTDEKWSQIRSWRNTRLSSLDWTQLADAKQQSRGKEIIEHRQKLRDIPQNISNPDDFNVRDYIYT